jgi:hypothetical protein
MKQEKRILPNNQSQAYMILSLIAISGELPTNQINRLPGGGEYKNKLIKNLKNKKLINTYYKDKLRGYKLTVNGNARTKPNFKNICLIIMKLKCREIQIRRYHLSTQPSMKR